MNRKWFMSHKCVYRHYTHVLLNLTYALRDREDILSACCMAHGSKQLYANVLTYTKTLFARIQAFKMMPCSLAVPS